MMGVERRSKVVTEEDKKLVAYHEAGHAIAGINSHLFMTLFIRFQLYLEVKQGELHFFYLKKIKDYHENERT